MTSDGEAALIREATTHQQALNEHRAEAAEHQIARDRIVHQLRASDPERWSYAKIAEAIDSGLKPENVVFILRKPAPA